MDERNAWQAAYHQELQQQEAPKFDWEGANRRVGSFSNAHNDEDTSAVSSGLRGHAVDNLVYKTESLHACAADFSKGNLAFRRAARRSATTRAASPTAAHACPPSRITGIGSPANNKKKMGVTFRDSSSEGNVWIGKRTVKEGEACGVWNLKGRYKVVAGPKRQWMCMSRVRFLDRHIADTHQYLVVSYRDGRKEHKRGPVAMFEDPVKHASIAVLNAVTVDAFEVIIVYSEDERGSVKRSVIHGPTVFVPETSQWLHVFRWHGSVNGDQFSKVPGALVFTKLRTIADQFYYDAQGVRTADDASLKVKVMVFFCLDDLEKMLNSTHDPIGDFINGLLADLMNFGSRHTYEGFIQQAQQLSDLGTYKTLVQRAAAVGFKINKVVYRGYTASDALQSLCDKAIRTRTEMRLKQEESEQSQRLRDMDLKGNTSRGDAERGEEMAKQQHKLAMELAVHEAALKREAAAHAQQLKKTEAEHKEKLKQRSEAEQTVLEAKREADAAQLHYLKGLKDMGVDLTQYLVACAEKTPDKVLKLAMPSSSHPQPLNLHTNI